MPHPSWATDEQIAWLSSCRPAFVEAQAEKTSRAFLNATAETFLQKWPPLPPTDVKLTEAGGDKDKYYKNKKEKKSKVSQRTSLLLHCEYDAYRSRQQIDWWLRNRERANVTGSTTSSTAVLDLKPQRTRPLMPYHCKSTTR